jgi:HSP20 family protein
MAEFGTKRQRPEEQTSLTPSERTEEVVARRSEGRYLPSIFSVSPGEFFTMSPITLMRRFTEDIDRAFSGYPGNFGRGSGEQDLTWMPAVEVRDAGNNLVIHADLPGLTENDVKVEGTEEGLVLEGERKREQASDQGGWHRSERVYGRFYRLIPLPEGAKIDQASANFRNGVLEINVPLSEAERKRRQIPIATTGTGGQAKAATSGR